MSNTRANEGTLRVFPNIKISSAYLILRPFFKASRSLVELDGDRATYLAAENWVLNLDGPEFPNSVPGHGQELNDETHPHLDLTHTMTSLPVVRITLWRENRLLYWDAHRLSLETRYTGIATSSMQSRRRMQEKATLQSCTFRPFHSP